MMLKKDLDRVIVKQQADLKKDNGIKRDFEVKQINNFVTIITGVRRCGKSTLVRKHLENKRPIYYTYFEDISLAEFSLEDFISLEEKFEEKFGPDGIFFFDEIQNINGWEKYVRELVDRGKKVIITGSNSSMLSRELGSRLTGRHISLELYPFSYNEYLRINDRDHKIDLFKNYLKEGGFPEFVKSKDSDILKNLFMDILYRDVIVRNDIKNDVALKNLISHLISNIGKLTSFNKLKDIVNVKSTNTITQFMDYLENAYVLFSVKKYDHSFKRQLVNPKKIYCIDSGIIESNAFMFSDNLGRILENTVFIELKRRRKEIYYHKDDKECDFVCVEKNKVCDAYQVTWDLTHENKKREIDGLSDAMDKYGLKEGYILTFDYEDKITENRKKIIILPVWKWILSDQKQ
ncbi:MAG: ATP-binding protein [Candidatus Woesearchaeota archaeon]